ncbi:hypothetical protein C8J57DRAFT_1517984 [Mycena rebaudengoi]|nr:hypothetical protein C8J57DRAFT_1517984 [Mycena rebaudengoi]
MGKSMKGDQLSGYLGPPQLRMFSSRPELLRLRTQASLINGRGRFVKRLWVLGPPVTTESARRTNIKILEVPYAVITVTQGLRYSHTFDVMELDGVEHDPVALQNGEGLRCPTGGSPSVNPNSDPALTKAILHYVGAPDEKPTTVKVPEAKLDDGLMHPIAAENPGRYGAGAPGFAKVLSIDTVYVCAVSSALTELCSYLSPSLPVLLQLLSGAAKPTDFLPSEQVIVLPKNTIVDISVPGGGMYGHNFDVIKQPGSDVFNFKNPARRDFQPSTPIFHAFFVWNIIPRMERLVNGKPVPVAASGIKERYRNPPPDNPPTQINCPHTRVNDASYNPLQVALRVNYQGCKVDAFITKDHICDFKVIIPPLAPKFTYLTNGKQFREYQDGGGQTDLDEDENVFDQLTRSSPLPPSSDPSSSSSSSSSSGTQNSSTSAAEVERYLLGPDPRRPATPPLPPTPPKPTPLFAGTPRHPPTSMFSAETANARAISDIDMMDYVDECGRAGLFKEDPCTHPLGGPELPPLMRAYDSRLHPSNISRAVNYFYYAGYDFYGSPLELAIRDLLSCGLPHSDYSNLVDHCKGNTPSIPAVPYYNPGPQRDFKYRTYKKKEGFVDLPWQLKVDTPSGVTLLEWNSRVGVPGDVWSVVSTGVIECEECDLVVVNTTSDNFADDLAQLHLEVTIRLFDHTDVVLQRSSCDLVIYCPTFSMTLKIAWPTINGLRVPPKYLVDFLQQHQVHWACFCAKNESSSVSCRILRSAEGTHAHCHYSPPRCSFYLDLDTIFATTALEQEYLIDDLDVAPFATSITPSVIPFMAGYLGERHQGTQLGAKYQLFYSKPASKKSVGVQTK